MSDLVVAIDDTDGIEEGATGKLAELIAGELAGKGRTTGVTRHQLFIHDSIPYTSHNSAMAFTVSGPSAGEVFGVAARILEERSVGGSDPGLCIAELSDEKARRDLIDFGRRAKVSVLSVEEALLTARRTGVSLTAHGGTGGGVIGALAGAGLRVSGNDGRFRGWLDVPEGETEVSDLLRIRGVEGVVPLSGVIGREETVIVKGRVKTVLLNGRSVLLVCREDGAWRNLTKEEIKRY